MTAKSSQSDLRTAQSGRGRLTLSPVLLLRSATVNQSLGNGAVPGVDRSNSALTAGELACETRSLPLRANRKTRMTAIEMKVLVARSCFSTTMSLPYRPRHPIGHLYSWVQDALL